MAGAQSLTTLLRVSGEFPEDWFRPDPTDDAAGDAGQSVDTPAGEVSADQPPPEPTAQDQTSPDEADGAAEASPDQAATPSSPSAGAPSGASPSPTTAGPVDDPPVGADPATGGRVSAQPTTDTPDEGPGEGGPGDELLPPDVTPSGGTRAEATGWQLKESGEVPVVTSATVAATVDLDDLLPPQRRGVKWRRLWLFLVWVVLLALVAGLAGGTLIRNALDARPAVVPTVTATPTANGTALQPWTGYTSRLQPTLVNASCVAPAGTDGSGDWVSFDPSNLIDEQASTAWRCNGTGVNETLDFIFAPGSTLVGVGILNGYGKSVGTTSLYDQYRRAGSVRWDLPDGSWFIQNLSENNSTVQQLMIPPTAVEGTVRLTILTTTSPGQRGEESRDALLLSTVSFLTKG